MRHIYPDVNPWDLEPHYSRHVAAMTAERLEGKAAIAEQLAWRDARISALETLAHAAIELRGYAGCLNPPREVVDAFDAAVKGAGS